MIAIQQQQRGTYQQLHQLRLLRGIQLAGIDCDVAQLGSAGVIVAEHQRAFAPEHAQVGCGMHAVADVEPIAWLGQADRAADADATERRRLGSVGG